MDDFFCLIGNYPSILIILQSLIYVSDFLLSHLFLFSFYTHRIIISIHFIPLALEFPMSYLYDISFLIYSLYCIIKLLSKILLICFHKT